MGEPNYCPACGSGVEGASFCPNCGADLAADKKSEPKEPPQTQEQEAQSTQNPKSPVISLVLLGFGWLIFLVSYPQLVSGQVSIVSLMGTLCVFGSIPLLWYDARGAIRSGDLSTSRPIYIVIAVYLLYLLTLPFYVLYRGYKMYR